MMRGPGLTRLRVGDFRHPRTASGRSPMPADPVATRLSTLTEDDRHPARVSMARAEALVDAVVAISAAARRMWHRLARPVAAQGGAIRARAFRPS